MNVHSLVLIWEMVPSLREEVLQLRELRQHLELALALHSAPQLLDGRTNLLGHAYRSIFHGLCGCVPDERAGECIKACDG